MIVSTPSILITDDDLNFRETLRGVFEPRGFRTLEAGDGEEALRILQRERVDLMLLDMHMPRLSGLETLRRLQELHFLVPCILLSAQLDDLIVEQAQRARAYSVLSKTVTISQITGIVRQALESVYHGSEINFGDRLK
jgi:CheY-like chemotaxis protein